jgi:uncharacterized membrane protein YeaQ/YmgE (transglycosylase-associated protein family)
MWGWIALIAVGIVVGALGRLLHPGRDPVTLVWTMIIGVGSLGLAGVFFSTWWVALLVGAGVAAVVLVLFAWYVHAQTELPDL